MSKLKSLALVLPADSAAGLAVSEQDAAATAAGFHDPAQRVWTVTIGPLPRERVTDADEFERYINTLPNVGVLRPGALILVNGEDDRGRYCAELLLLKGSDGESFRPIKVGETGDWLSCTSVPVSPASAQ